MWADQVEQERMHLRMNALPAPYQEWVTRLVSDTIAADAPVVSQWADRRDADPLLVGVDDLRTTTVQGMDARGTLDQIAPWLVVGLAAPTADDATFIAALNGSKWRYHSGRDYWRTDVPSRIVALARVARIDRTEVLDHWRAGTWDEPKAMFLAALHGYRLDSQMLDAIPDFAHASPDSAG